MKEREGDRAVDELGERSIYKLVRVIKLLKSPPLIQKLCSNCTQ